MEPHSYKEARTPASRGKQLSHLTVKEGEEGGHSVEHHYEEDGMAYHKPKEYTFGKDEGDELVHHLKKHLHISESKEYKQGEGEPEQGEEHEGK